MSTSNTPTPAGKKTPAMAALAAWIGSAMEYYDFFIYGTAAALVFGKVFFPGSSPSMGLLLALATFGVGYVARPVGAFFLGHIGDKFGRKRVLVFTLVLMGASTFLVGCLPTYGHVGMLAPALLVLLRLCQGFSASGEQAGANSMSLEHAPSDRRAFFTSFTLSGTQAGLILATAVFLPISRLPEDQLLSWGWRVPFWLSAVVVLIGYLIRRNLNETPVFEQEQRTRHVARMPLAVLFKHYSGDVLRVVLCALVSTVSTIFGVFALSYAVNVVKIDRGTMLWVAILTNIVALVAIPLFAMLADRIGRKPVYLFGILGPAVLMFPYLWSIEQQNVPLIFLFGVLMSGVAYSASNGIWPSFFAEMFDTRVRLSGMAIGTQIGFALAGFAPTIAAALMKTGPGAWVPVAWFVAGACALAALATLTARETYDIEMDDLGRKEDSPVGTKAHV
ncbi:MFS transporter [Burkholderia anthina]|uniref:MHS family MFS transporter n=1 Tax=Burkholderia anthina TaxID=179879 RepID=A0A6P2G4V1_9BURK|nr:MFS transporter [Burkholderia anthina]MBM2766368.1 MHS family MFS transporter [Burkholderia anthina]VVU48738.1 major facilitator transporter [Burkholderia anthina]